VAQGPAEPVEPDDDEGVPGTKVVEHLVEPGSAVERTGRGLGPDPGAAGFGECGLLASVVWSAVLTLAYPSMSPVDSVSHKRHADGP
jgi:hypothetical protein